MIINRVTLADSYKYSHTKQYPANTVSMFDYAEARSSKLYDKTVFFGLQYILQEYFSTPIQEWEVEEAAKLAEMHGIPFAYDGWMYIVNELKGMLPVEIKAVPEGTVVPLKNVLFTVESTDANVYWVTSWLETILMKVWYPSNVATRSYYVKQLLEEYAEKTSDAPFTAFQYHNFGDRGSSSVEAAAIGGMAHLTQFMGTDNFNSIRYAMEFYDSKIDATGFSIPATEHSSTTSWERENEMDMIMNHLENNKGRDIIAAVMDSYDYFKAVQNVTAKDGDFQKKINSDEYPVFVMRPDSGKPEEIVPKTLDIMEANEVPFIVNEKGFKVFNKMRIIWGDGINMESMKVMLDILVDRGYSSENIAFGSGGWLMQQHDRDTQGWAVKCSSIDVETESGVQTVDVYKDPITAPGKKSKKGKITLWRNNFSKEYFTASVDFKTNEFSVSNCLGVVYKNGKIRNTYTFDQVRENSKG